MIDAHRESRSVQERHGAEIEAFVETRQRTTAAFGAARDLLSLARDPRRFTTEKLVPFLAGRERDRVLSMLREEQGSFSGAGQSLVQETYGFIFDGTAGNAGLHATNPLIRAIQGAATNEIRRAHSHAIRELEAAFKQISEIDAGSLARQTPASSSRASPSPAPRSDSPERGRHTETAGCGILDGPDGMVLAVEDPRAFDELTKRCLSRGR